MNRIADAFHGKKAFVAYLMAGDPSLAASAGYILAAQDAGADLDTWADVTRAGFRQSGQAAGADGTGRAETA